MRIGGDGRKGRKRAAANFTGHLWHNLRLFGLAKIPTARTTTMLARKLNRLALIAVVGALPATPTSAADDAAKEQVRATELAFARTMAERNLSAFGEFIAGEAVFFDGTTVLRGSGYLPFPQDDNSHHAWGIYAFAGGGANLVARNLVLDGNTFADSRSVDKRLFLPAAEVGASLWTRYFQATFAYVMWGKEYYGQKTREDYVSGLLSCFF